MKEFRKRLKEERQHIGLTQKQMAEKLNVPLNTYKNYESHGLRHCEPSIEMLSKMADILKVTIDYLVGREPI